MLYPKIERKSLALVVICLILTLATVGIIFVIYFFYSQNNTLLVKPIGSKLLASGNTKVNSISAGSETYHHRHHSNQQQSQSHHKQQHHVGDAERPSASAIYSTINSDNNQRRPAKTISSARRHHQLVLSTPRTADDAVKNRREGGLDTDDSTHEIEISDETFNANGNFYTNSDTIYIDDYDRMLDGNVKAATPSGGDLQPVVLSDQLDINKIDYFETIIMDHKSSRQQQQSLSLPSNRKSSAIGKQQRRSGGSFGAKRLAAPSSRSANENLIIYTKTFNSNRWKKPPVSRSDQLNEPGRSDELLDNATIGSGSGDFIDEEEDDDDDTVAIATSDSSLPTRSDTKKYRNANHNENLYSVSSEFVSNLSNPNGKRNRTLLLSSTAAAAGPSSFLNNKKWIPPSIVSSREQQLPITSIATAGTLPTAALPKRTVPSRLAAAPTTNTNHHHQQHSGQHQNSGAWLETRARRIMGNVKKSEERSRQLLLCAEAGGGELCRMLFKGHLNE